jgi:predicted protein tyrosine phosphatase
LTDDEANEEVLDLVDRWHAGHSNGLQIYEYIGVSRETYAAWMERRISDRELLEARKKEVQ